MCVALKCFFSFYLSVHFLTLSCRCFKRYFLLFIFISLSSSYSSSFFSLSSAVPRKLMFVSWCSIEMAHPFAFKLWWKKNRWVFNLGFSCSCIVRLSSPRARLHAQKALYCRENFGKLLQSCS